VRLSLCLWVATLTARLVLAAGSGPFVVAYVHPADTGIALTLFPLVGKEVTVPAPPGLSNIGRAVSSSDGKTIYVLGRGVWRNDLMQHRQSIVRGTSGFSAVWHFTTSENRIFVSGILNVEGRVECGTYVVAPDSEIPLRLLAGTFPDCGGGGGEVSPDGTLVLSHSGGDLALVDLKSGKPQIVRGLRDLKRDDVTWKGQGAWSPPSATAAWSWLMLRHPDSAKSAAQAVSSGGPPIPGSSSCPSLSSRVWRTYTLKAWRSSISKRARKIS